MTTMVRTPIDAALEAASKIDTLSVVTHIDSSVLLYGLHGEEAVQLEKRIILRQLGEAIAEKLYESTLLRGEINAREYGSTFGSGMSVELSFGVVSRHDLSLLTVALRAAKRKEIV